MSFFHPLPQKGDVILEHSEGIGYRKRGDETLDDVVPAVGNFQYL